ncbi:zinc finger, CCHC-type, retrotransposon gag domain protein, partial [Tanacetum coccineum]
MPVLLTSHGGSVWMHPSYHARFDLDMITILVACFLAHIFFSPRQMPPRRNRVNTKANPDFVDVVEQAVATLLPTLTAWITDQIQVPEAKPQTFSSASTPVEAKNWIARIEKIFEVWGCDDKFKAILATYKVKGDAHSWWRAYKQAKVRDQQYSRSSGSSSQRGYSNYAPSSLCNLCGKLHPRKACHKATGACFSCGQVGHLAKYCKKGSTSNDGNGNNKHPATKGRVFTLTIDKAPKAP